jgi:Rrf2 family protein
MVSAGASSTVSRPRFGTRSPRECTLEWLPEVTPLKVTAKAEYACLALIDLARRQSAETPVHIWEIADAQRIPQSTLTQVMIKLKGAGLVQSARGSAGGYWLARPPEEITLGEVLMVIDGKEDLRRELAGASARVLATVWNRIRTFESQVLAETSIAQLAGRISSSHWVN